MSQKRKRVDEKFVVAIFVENGEETKSVVSKRWVDDTEGLLWWPLSGANVLRKKISDPDMETWNSFKLIKIVIEGISG